MTDKNLETTKEVIRQIIIGALMSMIEECRDNKVGSIEWNMNQRLVSKMVECLYDLDNKN